LLKLSYEVNPPLLFGPLSEALPIPNKPGWSTISTDIYVLHLISPHATFPTFLGYGDVRDIAKAHVLALNGKSLDPSRKKRLPINSPHAINYDDVLRLIADKRPELKERVLQGAAPHYTGPQSTPPLDLQRVEDVLGLKPSEYHSLESTVLDSIDSLLELEKFWASKGHDVRAPVQAW
jgi:nucleoside-diphosphate-sugar epimerase